MQNAFERNLEQALYGSRMLVFLETPDGFSQVRFKPDHFKKVSDAVAAGFPIHDCGDPECLEIEIYDQTLPVDLFDGMTDYEEETDD